MEYTAIVKRREEWRHGCTMLREGRRHSIWQNARGDRQTAIPRHGEVDNLLVRDLCEARRSTDV